MNESSKRSPIRHGEVVLVPVDVMPSEFESTEHCDKSIIAHSETGHHHVLETKTKGAITIMTTVDGTRFVELGDIAELWHQKTGKDVHTAHKVAPGAYRISIKKEFDYFSGLLRSVRD